MENLEKVIADSTNWSQVSKKIYGYKSAKTYRELEAKAIELDIDFSHFKIKVRRRKRIIKICPVCNESFETVDGSTHEKITCSHSCSNTYFRTKEDTKYNYREKALNHYGKKCSICDEDREHVLQVHHIDLNRDNNDIDNLKVLCANCHLDVHFKNDNMKDMLIDK